VGRNVKGTLFVDYVRMLRRHRGFDWSRHLTPADLELLTGRIEPESWYPMAAFERMGLAILTEIARGDVASRARGAAPPWTGSRWSSRGSWSRGTCARR
jgi:hypothetical protein